MSYLSRAVFPAVFLLSTTTVQGRTHGTHCSPSEKAIFSCQISAGRVLSLCSSKALSATHGYIQYRVGALGNVTLTYPKVLAPPKGRFYYHSAGLSGGYEEHVSFVIGNRRHVVFDYFLSPKSPTERETKDAGVLIITRNSSKRFEKCLAPKDVRFNDGNLLDSTLDAGDFWPSE